MQPRSDSHLHLSIWRPVVIDRRYLYGSGQGREEGNFVPIINGGLLEQVYAWDAGPNDVLGACTPCVGEQIKEKIVYPFASNQLPGKRTVRCFLDTIHEMLSNESVQSGTYWTDCQETVKPKGDDEVNVRANIALALLQHFHWVACVFLDVPKASVLIR